MQTTRTTKTTHESYGQHTWKSGSTLAAVPSPPPSPPRNTQNSSPISPLKTSSLSSIASKTPEKHRHHRSYIRQPSFCNLIPTILNNPKFLPALNPKRRLFHGHKSRHAKCSQYPTQQPKILPQNHVLTSPSLITPHHSSLLNHGLDQHFLYSLLLVPSILLVQFLLDEQALVDPMEFPRVHEENVEQTIFEE